MGRNRYIRDRYKSRSPQRPLGAPRIRQAPKPPVSGKKAAILLCCLAILTLAALALLLSGPDQGGVEAPGRDQAAPDLDPQAGEDALYQEALNLAEDDYGGRLRLYQELLDIAPGNQEYRRQAELAREGVLARRQALLDQIAAIPAEDNSTLLSLYTRLLELEPGNADYIERREFFARRIQDAARSEEEELYRRVLEVPAEDYESNMRYYARLMELNPEKALYREKYASYAARAQEELAAREQRLLNQVRAVPAEDNETNMLFYKELTELNPEEPSYRERYDHYAAAFEQQRAAMEEALYAQVRQVPATDYETNMVLYEQLMEINPHEPTYKEKYEHYLAKFYEAQGIAPPQGEADPGAPPP